MPRLPHEFEFEVVFKYRLVTELHCVHKVQTLSWLWSLLKTEFKWIQTLINNIYANGHKPKQIILLFHSITQQSDLGWISSYVGCATCAKKKKKSLRSSWYLFKIFVLQSWSLLSSPARHMFGFTEKSRPIMAVTLQNYMGKKALWTRTSGCVISRTFNM